MTVNDRGTRPWLIKVRDGLESSTRIAIGPGGQQVIFGSAGEDWLIGGRALDRMFGAANDDWLFGGRDRDRMFGGGGSDRLFGGPGGDWLYGSGGNDRLVGGPGFDVLHGGNGADRFVSRQPDSSVDTVRRFSGIQGDKIVLHKDGFGISNLDELVF
ncbi:MAG: calcium-binding protein, partial [Cyanobacteria bacterium P01_G01_bin.4]